MLRTTTGILKTGILTLLFTAGCGGASPVAEVRIGASKKSPAPVNEGDRLATVVTPETPKGLAIDGDIGEWGNILPPPPKPAPRAKEPPPTPASHLAIAVGSDGVSIAGMLGGEATDGLWIGLQLGFLPVPQIGTLARWGGLQDLNCDYHPDGTPTEPEEEQSCRALLTAREEFGEAQSARLRRLYRLDRKGLRFVDEGGKLVPVPGAKVVFKDGKAGVTVEVAFPQKALPRTASAPLAQIGVSARAGSEGDPPKEGGDFESYDLPVPVGFEPYAALRAAAYGIAQDHAATGLPLSYQPGDGVELEEVTYAPGDFTSLMTMPRKLFEPMTTWSGFQIGYAYTLGNAVAVLDKDGGLVAINELSGERMGFAEHDGELHVYSYEENTPPDDSASHADWSVIAVQKDGTIRNNLVDSTGGTIRWVNPVEFHDKDFTRIGVRGTYADNYDHGEPAVGQAVWLWNPKEKAYGMVLDDDEPEPPAKGKASLPKSKPSPKKSKGKK